MVRSDFLVSLALLAVSSFYLVSARGLPLGAAGGRPAAGTFPFIVGVLFVALAVLNVARATKALVRHRASLVPINGVAIRTGLPIVVLAASTFLYLAAVGAFGYVAATLAYVFLVMRLYFKVRWSSALLAAIALSAATFVVFRYGLRVPLPAGSVFG